MSHLSNISGTIATRKAAHMSLPKIIRSVFEEQTKPVAETERVADSMIVYNVNFNFCNHGSGAVTKMEEFETCLKDVDKHVELRLFLTVYWC